MTYATDSGTIIPVPSEYEPPAETKDFVDTIASLEFEQRINFTRSLVVAMGANPK